MNRWQIYLTECYDIEGDDEVCWDTYPIAHPVETDEPPAPLTVKRRVPGETTSFVAYHMEWRPAA